jgi:hypothetical protein
LSVLGQQRLARGEQKFGGDLFLQLLEEGLLIAKPAVERPDRQLARSRQVSDRERIEISIGQHRAPSREQRIAGGMGSGLHRLQRIDVQRDAALDGSALADRCLRDLHIDAGQNSNYGSNILVRSFVLGQSAQTPTQERRR